MHVPNSSWIDSISYLRAEDQSTFLAIFLETSPPAALLYAGVPSWIPGLLMAGIRNGDGKRRSIGKAYNKLVKGKYAYERVEGEEKVRELRRLIRKGKEIQNAAAR